MCISASEDPPPSLFPCPPPPLPLSTIPRSKFLQDYRAYLHYHFLHGEYRLHEDILLEAGSADSLPAGAPPEGNGGRVQG